MKLFVLNALVSLFVVAVGIAAYHHTVRSPADRIGVIDVTEVYRLKEKEFTDKTKVHGVEIFNDPNTKATLYITESGTIAAVAAK